MQRSKFDIRSADAGAGGMSISSGSGGASGMGAPSSSSDASAMAQSTGSSGAGSGSMCLEKSSSWAWSAAASATASRNSALLPARKRCHPVVRLPRVALQLSLGGDGKRSRLLRGPVWWPTQTSRQGDGGALGPHVVEKLQLLREEEREDRKRFIRMRGRGKTLL